MDTTLGRQWRVFYAYTAWSVVLVLVLLPLGIALFHGTKIPALLAVQPAATVLLIVQIALGAWSGWRSLEAWAAAEASPAGTAGGSAGWAVSPWIRSCWPPSCPRSSSAG